MPIVWFAQGRQASDSWTSLDMGHAYFNGAARERSLYEATFFSRRLDHKGFQYPPTSLLVMDAADVLFGSTRRFLEVVTWLWIPVTAVLIAALDRRLAASGHRGPRAEGWARAALAAFATLTFYPLMRAYANGQVQTWINGLFAGAVLAWVCGRAAVAGALVALMAAFKPQAAFVLVWAVVRGKWRFVAGFAAVAVPLLAASIAAYGLPAHLEYLRVLAFLGRRGESFFPNHSVNGMLHRLLANGENLEFYRRGSTRWLDHFPPYNAFVHAATVVSSVLLLAAALWPPRSTAARAGTADFCMAALASTIASPIAWEHHYGVLLPILVVLWHGRSGSPTALRVLAVTYAVACNPWWVTRALAETPFNALQSYLLVAGLATLGLLHRLRGSVGMNGWWRMPRVAPPGPKAPRQEDNLLECP